MIAKDFTSPVNQDKRNKFVIVIGQDTIGLGLVRSLGEEGINSIVIYDSKNVIVPHSRYVINKVRINSFKNNEEIIDVLIKNKEKWRGLPVIPAIDSAIEALSFHKNELSKYYKIAVADYNIVEKLLDKTKTYKIADDAGIPRPKTWYPKSISEMYKIEKMMPFPCMIKPYKSQPFGRVFKCKLFIAKNIIELREKFIACQKNKIDVMLSEVIQGKDTNLWASYFYVSTNGNFYGGMTRKKLRQHPPKYGITNVSVSKLNNTVLRLSKKFLKQIPSYRGVGYIEFKYDERDDKYKLIEMNPRNVSWVLLATRCGINFPAIQYYDMVMKRQVKIKKFQENLYWIHLSNDLLDQFFDKNRKDEFFTFKEKVSPYLKNKVFAIESLSDPLPMILHWKNGLLNKLFSLKK